MKSSFSSVLPKISLVSLLLGFLLVAAGVVGISFGPSGWNIHEAIEILLSGAGDQTSVNATIIWQIRLPRVILAAVVGATLSLGGLVFQALLRNPLAEPYILGVSGGSAIGAIIGIITGLSAFPGVFLTAFAGSMCVLACIYLLAVGVAGRYAMNRESLLLAGVMINAFCSAVIMFLISITKSTQIHSILFWMMGDFSIFTREQIPLLSVVIPCFILIFVMARPMNLFLLGRETASTMGINVGLSFTILLIVSSFMVSVIVGQAGLVGFVGLVIPHINRLVFGPDHRVLVPACILGGAAYMVFCDILARVLPSQGEMPVGIITAIIGAPLFIFLLWRGRR